MRLQSVGLKRCVPVVLHRFPRMVLLTGVAFLAAAVASASPDALVEGVTLHSGASNNCGAVALRQLTVALKAVIQNALEALGHGGHVEVTVRHGAGEVEISVADDGPGIAPEERRHLFDPFYSARQAGRGLGMGLAKCWRIVTSHGGRIEVQDTPGRGATLLLHLPAEGPVPP